MYKAQRVSLEELLDSNTAVWDIEAGGLDADFDVILCATIKRFGQKKRSTYRIDKTLPDGMWDDSNLCWYIAAELEHYDYIVHHYGDRYDLPFVQTRLLKNEIELAQVAETRLVDTWWTLRHRYKMSRNTLARALDFFDCQNKKTPLSGDIWLQAKCGVKRALDYVVKHNVADVLALEELTMKLAKAAPLKYSYWR